MQSYHSLPVSLFVEHLTNLDFSYIDPMVGLCGQSWAVDVEITGETDHQGMLLDFGHIKKSIKQDIESLWDHKLVVLDTAQVQRNALSNTTSQLTWTQQQDQAHASTDHASTDSHTLCHIGPDISLYTMNTATLDLAFFEQHLQAWLLQRWQGPTIQDITITLYEESGDQAFFQYSHGLSLHKGACQRIAHGHRSKLQVFTKQGFDLELSKQLASQLHHVYFYDEAHVISGHSKDAATITLAYTAPEGDYQLTLPRANTVKMTSETTIENIARYLVSTAGQRLNRQDIKAVHVYEGFKKGAKAKLA